MGKNFKGNVKTTRVMNAVVAGGSNQNSSIIDMAGFSSVRFIALFGTLTAGAVTGIKLQSGDDPLLSDAVDIAGSAVAMADTDDNKCLIAEITGPTERYVRAVVTSSAQNAVIDAVVAEQFDANKVPVSDDATVAGNEQAIGSVHGVA